MRSIRFRFIAFLAALLLILLLMLNIYPVSLSRDAVFQEKHSVIARQATTLSLALSGMETLNRTNITEVLNVLDLDELDRVAVFDTGGEVLYDSADGALDTEDVLRALEGKTIFRSRFGDAAFLSSIAMPMSDQGSLTGVVFLQERDTERAEGIWTVQRHLRTLSMAIGAAALLLAISYVSLITRRLDGLIASMRTVAGGDYRYRHVIRGRDEFSELGKELNQLTEQLERNESERRRFVADASHELKTPLASIRLLSDSIVQSESMDAWTIREFVADIGGEAQRLQRTTEKLLTLSRLDDEIRIAPEPVDLSRTAQDATALLRPLAREKHVSLRTALGEGCVIMARRDDAEHILYNLLENAIKYNVPEGSVLVRTWTEEQQVLLAVEDTGIGIPEKDLPNIFERFYRVDKARSREAGGSGLGLSIVHDAVLAHGGSIEVGQNKPQGTSFLVRFPRPTSEETGI